MAIIMKKKVFFDGVETPVTLKFRHWFPKFLKSGGTAIGNNALFPRNPEQTALIIIAHELIHIYDFKQKASKIPGGYLFDVVGDLLVYFWDWIRAGFNYRKNKEEVWAYADEASVLNGTHPNIKAPWLTERHKQGFLAMAKVSGITIN